MRGLTLRLLGLEPAWPGLLRYPSAVPRLSTGNTPLVRPLRAPSRRLLRAAQPGRWCQWRLGGRRRVAAWTADADTDPNARGRSWAAGGQYRALEPDAGPAGFNVAAPRPSRSDYGAALRALIEMDFIKLGLTTKITRSLRGPPAQLQRGLTGLPLLICLALREGPRPCSRSSRQTFEDNQTTEVQDAEANNPPRGQPDTPAPTRGR